MTNTGISRFEQTDLCSEVEFLLARARALGTGEANTKFAELGLKARSYAVLALACSDLDPTQRELAEFLSLDASQIVSLVDQLEEAQLVSRKASKTDRRINVITATELGKAMYIKARTVAAQAASVSLKNLTEAEREQLRELLSKVAF
jgi:DNA-binding MarR family transcriptional regulator